MAKFKFLCYFETDSESPFVEVSSLGLTPISLLIREDVSATFQKWLPVMSDDKNESILRKEISELLNGDNLVQPKEADINELLPPHLTLFFSRAQKSISLYRVDEYDDAGEGEISSEMSEIGTLVYESDEALTDALNQIREEASKGSLASIDGIISHFQNLGV